MAKAEALQAGIAEAEQQAVRSIPIAINLQQILLQTLF
jgi:hypothetical protein